MGSEGEAEPSSTLKLPLFSIPPIESPEPSGILTPPLQTPASVPFRWEEEPGKPRPCTTLITLPNPNNNGPKCLDLPPRLLTDSKIIKTPSPTTVLDGPYVGKPLFSSSSFRFNRDREGSFDSCRRKSPEKGQLGSIVLDKRGLFGSWRKRTLKGSKKEIGGGSFVFSSSMELAGCGAEESGGSTKVKMARIRRTGSLSAVPQPRSQFWAAIYEGFKQVIPWKSRKSRKEGLIL